MVSHYVIMKSSVIHPRSDSWNWPRSSEWSLRRTKSNYSSWYFPWKYRERAPVGRGQPGSDYRKLRHWANLGMSKTRTKCLANPGSCGAGSVIFPAEGKTEIQLKRTITKRVSIRLAELVATLITLGFIVENNMEQFLQNHIPFFIESQRAQSESSL